MEGMDYAANNRQSKQEHERPTDLEYSASTRLQSSTTAACSRFEQSTQHLRLFARGSSRLWNSSHCSMLTPRRSRMRVRSLCTCAATCGLLLHDLSRRGERGSATKQSCKRASEPTNQRTNETMIRFFN